MGIEYCGQLVGLWAGAAKMNSCITAKISPTNSMVFLNFKLNLLLFEKIFVPRGCWIGILFQQKIFITIIIITD